MFFTVEEVSNKLRVCKRTVYRLIKRGRIKAVKFGGVYRIAEDDLEDFIKGN